MTVSIGLGRVGSNFFSLIVGWIGLGQLTDGLGWVTQNGPMDNSEVLPYSFPLRNAVRNFNWRFEIFELK